MHQRQSSKQTDKEVEQFVDAVHPQLLNFFHFTFVKLSIALNFCVFYVITCNSCTKVELFEHFHEVAGD